MFAPTSYTQFVSVVYRQRMNLYLVQFSGRHVAMLVTEIPRQDQNFRIIPRK